MLLGLSISPSQHVCLTGALVNFELMTTLMMTLMTCRLRQRDSLIAFDRHSDYLSSELHINGFLSITTDDFRNKMWHNPWKDTKS